MIIGYDIFDRFTMEHFPLCQNIILTASFFLLATVRIYLYIRMKKNTIKIRNSQNNNSKFIFILYIIFIFIFIYTPESCLENYSYKLYFDRTILTDIHIKHNRPDIIIYIYRVLGNGLPRISG
jgi:hypothetical protein